MKAIIEVNKVSKQYRLGKVGTGSLHHDINRWWHRARGKDDPYLRVGESNDRTTKASSEYVWALQDISFSVQPGEVLGIIGRNGAGKSTLLKILSRITSPTTGSYTLRGRVASLLEVGTGMHPDLTGRENVYLNGAILGMRRKEIDRKLDAIVDFSGVERYIDTPVKRYSSGMHVRLGFAVAAHLEPDILIVDEVLAVGDAEFQQKCLGKMKSVSSEEGRTVLFVSHNMPSIQNLCKRCILFENGMVNSDGFVDSVISDYINYNRTKSKDINQRNDAKGALNFGIRSIEIFDKHDNITTSLIAGGSYYFKLKIYSNIGNTNNEIRLDVGINNNKAERVGWLSTSLFPKKFQFLGQENCDICFVIEELPFNKGLFSLTVNLLVNDKPEFWLPDALYFNVYEGDFFKTGKLVPENQGSVLIKHYFKQN